MNGGGRPSVVALITARGGSKSVPRKNVLPLAGKPMIAWSILAGLGAGRVSRVIVSTDDDEIAQVAREWGAEVPFRRPAELAGDQTPHIDVLIHAVQWLDQAGQKPDYMLLLQPTSPLRTSADIDAAIELAVQKAADAVLGVVEMHPHPLIAMRVREDGTLCRFIEAEIPYLQRQALPPAFALNGAIYVNRCDSLVNDRTFWPTRTFPFVMPAERSLDLDSPWEFRFAEFILREREQSA
jgi:CMP-N-acetylneuraminic acid synthetase